LKIYINLVIHFEIIPNFGPYLSLGQFIYAFMVHTPNLLHCMTEIPLKTSSHQLRVLLVSLLWTICY